MSDRFDLLVNTIRYLSNPDENFGEFAAYLGEVVKGLDGKAQEELSEILTAIEAEVEE